jgi:hypothetical protein
MMQQLLTLVRTKRQACVDRFMDFIRWIEDSGLLYAYTVPRASVPHSFLPHLFHADPFDVIIDGANVGFYKNRPSVSTNGGRINFAQISRSASTPFPFVPCVHATPFRASALSQRREIRIFPM